MKGGCGWFLAFWSFGVLWWRQQHGSRCKPAVFGGRWRLPPPASSRKPHGAIVIQLHAPSHISSSIIPAVQITKRKQAHPRSISVCSISSNSVIDYRGARYCDKCECPWPRAPAATHRGATKARRALEAALLLLLAPSSALHAQNRNTPPDPPTSTTATAQPPPSHDGAPQPRRQPPLPARRQPCRSALQGAAQHRAHAPCRSSRVCMGRV